MPSSVISAILYDAKSATLRIIFVSGMVYDYKKVPQEIYNEMETSGSKGTYLNKHIKGNYEFEKISWRFLSMLTAGVVTFKPLVISP